MWFLILGLVLSTLKWLAVEPVAQWPWWAVLVPFALTVVWWKLHDAFGWTEKAQMKKIAQRQEKRRQRSLEALGLDRPSLKRLADREGFEGRLTRTMTTVLPNGDTQFGDDASAKLGGQSENRSERKT